MKIILKPALVSALLLLTACSSNNFKQIPYGCDSDESDPYCAGVEEIYDAALSHEERTINVMADDHDIRKGRDYNAIQSQVVSKSSHSGTKSSASVDPKNGLTDKRLSTDKHQLIGQQALESRPVYIPERVHRVYRGPWMDDNSILHSGEHLYYKTPGRWTFGNMKDPGSASGLISPVMPEDLGFEQGGDSTDQAEAMRVGRHMMPAPGSNAISKAGAAATNSTRAAVKKLD